MGSQETLDECEANSERQARPWWIQSHDAVPEWWPPQLGGHQLSPDMDTKARLLTEADRWSKSQEEAGEARQGLHLNLWTPPTHPGTGIVSSPSLGQVRGSVETMLGPGDGAASSAASQAILDTREQNYRSPCQSLTLRGITKPPSCKDTSVTTS